MAAYFGLHVGNSSVCLGLSKDEDRVDIIANDVGDRITPAILQWTQNACIVGKTAQLELFRNSTNSIIRNKLFLDDKISNEELELVKSQIPYKINKVDSNIKYELLIDGKQYHITPRETAGWIFKKIFSTAESAVGGNKQIKVVITVPLYFSQKSIQVIKEVANVAGFKVIQVVDEPTTAALGYGLDSDVKEPKYYCLVYRVGGYSVDATILEVHDGMFSVIHSVHKNNLGGALFTKKLSEHLATEFKRQYRTAEISERGKYKLYAAAETLKQVLSIRNEAQCTCESIGSGYDFNCSVSRARFENVIAPLMSDMITPIKEVIEKSGLSVDNIKKVVTCGGTLKTPKLLETVQKLLPTSEVLFNLNPDEIIALGAAKHAGYCARFDQLPTTLSLDAMSLSKSIIVKVQQEDSDEIKFFVPESTLVPVRKRFDVPCTGKKLDVFLLYSNNTILGSTCLDDLESPVKITLDLDINKEGKIFLTIINENNEERAYIKYDLSEPQKL